MIHLFKLSLLLFALLLPATATAYDFEVNGIYYSLSGDNQVYVTDADGKWNTPDYSGDITIPETVTYNDTTYSVTSIGDQAFQSCSGLTSVNIGNSVTVIGYSVFRNCRDLTSVTIPNSVISIGNEAFYGCRGLTTVTIGNSVTSIGERAFQGCSALDTLNFNAISCSDFSSTASYRPFNNLNISNINIGGNVQRIPAYFAYGFTNLTSITNPNSVTRIGYSAFWGCSGLTSVTIGNSVTTISDYAFQDCSGLTSVTIPNSVTSIGNYAFEGCSGLSSLTIGNSVTTIGKSAFYGCCGLTRVTIPNSVTLVGDYAFSFCSGLTCIQVESGNTTFDSRNNCNAIIKTANNKLIAGCKTTVIPNSVTAIGNYAFSGCSGLTSVNIPNAVTSIGNSAFFGCRGLASVTIPNSVTEIANWAFTNCSGLTSVTIGNSVTDIGYFVFQGCSALDTLNFNAISCSDLSSTASYHPFNNLNISNINIGDNVQRIPAYFAYGNANLNNVTIPNSVTSIGSSAFYNCSGLTRVNISDIEAWCKISFSNSSANPLSYGHHLYLNGEEVTDLAIPNAVTSIRNDAFYGCSGLTSVNIPNSVTSIGDYAFYRCSGLTSVTISNSVRSIGNSAFYGCSSLSSIDIPNSVTSISERSFEGCSGLISVTIGNSVTSIANNAFQGCIGLTSIQVESGNTTLDSRNNCNAIIKTASNTLIMGCKATVIPNSVTSIGESAFEGCIGLTSVTIPNSVTSIGYRAFYLCSGLISVNIGNSVTSIGERAFYNCSGLTSVTIPNSVTSIGDYAFQNCSGLNDVFSFIDNLTTVSIGSGVFYRDPSNYTERTLHVPFGTSAAYQANAGWSRFFGSIVEMEPILATSIELNQVSAELTEGATVQLTATVLPADATDKSVMWATSDEAVATVDENGLVTAVASGEAAITATTTDGSNLSASCAVTVAADLIDYDNYLSINDAEAFHGDTIVIPVAMTNAESIISFQTDIFLPDGLELLKEDGEYLIDASERMTRTHSIMSNDVASGAVRVICYSSNYKPFTGNSGDDLFYITVKVADDAEGDYIIQLKNTLLTNTDFVDLAAPDVAANVNVKAYLLGDANNSGTVTITDVVVTAQYVLEMNPNPFIFEAADVNFDNNITVADVSRIVWMVLNPTLNAPRRAPALRNNGDRMSGEGVTLMAGETRTVSIALDNEMDYSAFQLDLSLPEGLTASNFRLTDRAGSHAFDVNMLANGKTRALCYSPMLTAIRGHEGAVLTFDVTATTAIDGVINVDGIELVTTDCQTVRLDAFAIGVNSATVLNELAAGKTIAKVEYFNVAGQRLDRPESGVTLVVTTYTDGTRSTTKVIK